MIITNKTCFNVKCMMHESLWESISFYVQNKFVVDFVCSLNSYGLIPKTTNRLHSQNNI